MAQEQQQAGPAVANRHSHTQTIAAPLYFLGNVPPNTGELSALDFLHQMEIYMLGNNIHEDADKLSFALNAQQGSAHEWHMGLKIHEPNEFDITLISTQHV